jgi:hypothetical protein
MTELLFPVPGGDPKKPRKYVVEIPLFIRFLTYLPFHETFTKLCAISKLTRKLIMKNHNLISVDKICPLDLSATTKALKKLPKWLAIRLNAFKVKLKPDARLDRI